MNKLPRPASGPDDPDAPNPTEALVVPEEPVVHRPDGWYWSAPDGLQDFGPFATREEAVADLHAADNEDLDVETGEALREAEAEFGIADFIDPDTGEPAEGQGNPHLPRDD